ncbi:MAG TPA: tRNA dihydrouridine synthase DusB [Candidatus Eubacterium avistercoris]|uniref:tRNA-dihydrouridine synthase n=1 Tax=Candidatus Eubacterium avistercoris TaxID=2838567 RepID=A0A9D2D254_9FIRM|nr:tRNA dihydrouridine synthase DusB [Candidatus Eubacterium avistercoris]
MKKLVIGNVTLDNPLILAPMAGVTDLPFRLLCKEQGAGLICMEMVSAKAIYYKNKNTEQLLEISPKEHPISLQLFGSDPEIIAEMAARIEERPFDILDFNMGCPVPKVVNNGEGSALMKNPKLVEEILSRLVKAVKKPVTVKIRKGFDDDHVNAVEIAKIAESCGVAAIAVHGRTRQQYYSGKADWDIIRQVKEAVAVPVIGNGDLLCAGDVADMQEETGCDGFMIGRGAQGNPWIFKQIIHKLETGEDLPRPTVQEVCEMVLRHARLQIETKGEYTGIREIRKHAAWYTAGYKNSAKLRGRINEVESMEDLEKLFLEFGKSQTYFG